MVLATKCFAARLLTRWTLNTTFPGIFGIKIPSTGIRTLLVARVAKTIS